MPLFLTKCLRMQMQEWCNSMCTSWKHMWEQFIFEFVMMSMPLSANTEWNLTKSVFQKNFVDTFRDYPKIIIFLFVTVIKFMFTYTYKTTTVFPVSVCCSYSHIPIQRIEKRISTIFLLIKVSKFLLWKISYHTNCIYYTSLHIQID